MGVTSPNVATNRARKRSKVLRLATLNFVENFSPAPLQAAAVFHEEVHRRQDKNWGLEEEARRLKQGAYRYRRQEALARRDRRRLGCPPPR